jgi:outer membrane cobalamin receptor
MRNEGEKVFFNKRIGIFNSIRHNPDTDQAILTELPQDVALTLPEHNGNVSATLEMPWVNVGYTVTMVSKRYFLAQNIEANRIDGYSEHTATLWREFKLGKCGLRLQAEIINLTDAQYDVIKYYPMPGRSWRLTGTFNF